MWFSNVKGWKYKEKTFGGHHVVLIIYGWNYGKKTYGSHYVVLFIEDKKYEKKHLVVIGKNKYEVQYNGHQVKRMLKV